MACHEFTKTLFQKHHGSDHGLIVFNAMIEWLLQNYIKLKTHLVTNIEFKHKNLKWDSNKSAFYRLTLVAQQSVTKIVPVIFINFFTFKAGAKHELLFNKLASEMSVRLQTGWQEERKSRSSGQNICPTKNMPKYLHQSLTWKIKAS